QLMANLEALLPMRQFRGRYPFRGDDPMSLQEAMQMMERLQHMDELERQLKRAHDGESLDQIDPEQLGELLGPEARSQLEQLRQVTRALEEAGYIQKTGKDYDFGDPFLIDIQRTLMNSVQREGRGMPLQLKPNDFEVYRSELITSSSTVLMLDMSRSMLLRGCFLAAKKVAVALNSLIRSQYPRDNLYIIGF